MAGIVAHAAVLEFFRHVPEQQIGAVWIGIVEEFVAILEQVLGIIGGDALETCAIGDVERQRTGLAEPLQVGGHFVH